MARREICFVSGATSHHYQVSTGIVLMRCHYELIAVSITQLMTEISLIPETDFSLLSLMTAIMHSWAEDR
jgi:hypothetical protein